MNKIYNGIAVPYHIRTSDERTNQFYIYIFGHICSDNKNTAFHSPSAFPYSGEDPSHYAARLESSWMNQNLQSFHKSYHRKFCTLRWQYLLGQFWTISTTNDIKQAHVRLWKQERSEMKLVLNIIIKGDP